MKTKRRVNTEPSKTLLLECQPTEANREAIKELRKRLRLLDRTIILLCSISLEGRTLTQRQNTEVGAIIKKFIS